jgi:tRNA (guanine37-N1)-methyltransferase
VPEILLSGHQAKIEEWLYEESVRHTMERRPDLLEE